MGNVNSQTQKLAIEQFNQNVTNVTQNITNQSSANCSITQNVEIVNNGNLYGCSYEIEQIAVNNCNLQASSASTSSSDVINTLLAAVDSTASSSSKAVSDFLQTTLNYQETNTDIKSVIKNIIQTNVSSNTLSTCVLGATVNQDGKLINNGNIWCSSANPVLKFDQTAQNQLIASCLTDTVVKSISQNDTVLKAVNDAAAIQDSLGNGLGSVIKNFISAYQNILIVVAIVCCVVIIGALFGIGKVLLSPGAQEAISKSPELASQVIQARTGGGMGGALRKFSSSRDGSFTRF
jgi:hypothetical protein